MMVDRDDIDQAIEIAIGDRLSHESFQPRAVSGGAVSRWRRQLRRLLAELPEDVTVLDMREAIDE